MKNEAIGNISIFLRYIIKLQYINIDWKMYSVAPGISENISKHITPCELEDFWKFHKYHKRGVFIGTLLMNMSPFEDSICKQFGIFSEQFGTYYE